MCFLRNSPPVKRYAQIQNTSSFLIFGCVYYFNNKISIYLVPTQSSTKSTSLFLDAYTSAIFLLPRTTDQCYILSSLVQRRLFTEHQKRQLLGIQAIPYLKNAGKEKKKKKLVIFTRNALVLNQLMSFPQQAGPTLRN